jgi:hypothetical protein
LLPSVFSLPHLPSRSFICVGLARWRGFDFYAETAADVAHLEELPMLSLREKREVRAGTRLKKSNAGKREMARLIQNWARHMGLRVLWSPCHIGEDTRSWRWRGNGTQGLDKVRLQSLIFEIATKRVVVAARGIIQQYANANKPTEGRSKDPA